VTYEAEVVIVGAGIAGGSLATALARGGKSVLLLDKSVVHKDVVRGEFLVPWGVEEATKLGVLDVLLDAGGHCTPFSVPYGEGVPPDVARTRRLDLGKLVPGVAGPLTFGHPQMCQALDDAAAAAGGAVLRGISDLKVEAGDPPTLSFSVGGQHQIVKPRLIVGADGRGSTVGRQAGLRPTTDPDHHLMAGLLVDGVPGWPEDEFSIGTEGDVRFYVFPQGRGRVRLYFCYGLDQSTRFSGADKERKFLEAFRLSSLPQSDLFVSAQPAGPCHGYPNADSWIETPVARGIVLIGDAAGHNDPTIGQGLALAFRDARLVSEALLGSEDWTTDTLTPYAEERRERMKRLRFAAKQVSILTAEFSEEARMRRRRVFERMAADPNLRVFMLPALKGPYGVPDHVFDQAAWDDLFR
jgi:2-polyprenyl-6-methoxyphenol hydroxylase-like FAD-dependent oxidoreductase